MSSPSATDDRAAAGQATLPKERPARLSAGAAWVVLGRCAGVAGMALLGLVVPHCLSQADCGRFWLAHSLIGLTATLAAAGLPLAIVRLLGEALAHRDAQRLRGVCTASLQVLGISSSIVVLAAGAALLAGGAGRLQLDLPTAGLVAGVMAAGLLAWQQVLVEATRGLGELRWASLFAGGQTGGPIGTLLFVAGLFLLAAASPVSASRAFFLFAGSLAATIPLVLCGLAAAWRRTLGEVASSAIAAVESQPARGVLAIALPILAAQLLAYATLSADMLIAGQFVPKEEVALLGQARRLFMLLQLPSQIAVLTVLPTVARLHAQGARVALGQLVRRAATWSALAALPAAAVLICGAGPILALLFGASYRLAAPFLIALCVGQAIAVQSGLAGYVLLMAGRQRAVLAANASTAALMLCLGPLAAWSGGLQALTIVAAAILALQSLLEWWLAHRLLGVWTHADWRLVRSGRLFTANAAP